MNEKLCPFCHKSISSDSDTIIGYDNQLYHYDCYMEYEDEMKEEMKVNKEISYT